MLKIVGIGANVYDTLIVLPKYPSEDTKLCAKSKISCGGGPCATGLAACAKLGGSSGYIGNITDDDAGKFLISDFQKYGVSTEYITEKKGYSSFVSYVMLSEATTSRTIVFDRGNVPKLVLNDVQRKAVCQASILMVDGNELEAAIEAASLARQNGTTVLYDAGGLYDGVERLLPLCDVIIPSEEFALSITGCTCAGKAAKALYDRYNPNVVVITCGKAGGVMYDGVEIKQYDAFTVDAVDSNGAGDVFHGAFAFALSKNFNYYKACLFSSAVSALKCTKIGARAGAPDYKTTVKFLKERGVNEFEKDMD